MDVKRHHEQFAQKSAKLMLWGDMLLAREESNDSAANAASLKEARSTRAALPKDAIICDWHYEPAKPADYKSLGVFKEAGFKTIACTWFNPENIHTFAQAAKQNDALGLLQTTWAGYSMNESTMRREFKQFSAYVLAAEYAWNPDSPPPGKLPWRAEDAFVRAWRDHRSATSTKRGFEVDLTSIANASMEIPLDLRVEGYAFHADNKVIAMAGALSRGASGAPRSVSLTLDQSAEELAILHATEFRAPAGEVVGEYRVAFDDGTSETIELKYGQNIRAVDDLEVTSDASIACSRVSASGVPEAARLLVWESPRPGNKIVSITLSTKHPYASPILIGLTGMQGKHFREAASEKK
jgi:hypothetical protein